MNEIEKALAYLKDSVKYAEKCSNAKEVKSIINTAITVLEQRLNGGWILASERLPDKEGYYLIQQEYNLEGQMRVSKFDTITSKFRTATPRLYYSYYIC